jgi:imidazolonepropionase-like amidohydrolase
MNAVGLTPLLAVRAGCIFDGDRALGAGMVLIENTRIIGVDTGGNPPPDHAVVTDLGEDVCLMPGLIDCHVHLALDATPEAMRTIATIDDDALLSQMTRAAERILRAGITTVRDLGDRGFLSLQLREQIARDHVLAPEIVAAGPPLTTKGGHLAVLGGETEDRQGLIAAVRERAARGCDVVKVIASGGNLTPGSIPYESQYSANDLRTVVETAHALGLATVAHAHAATSIAEAVDAGFDTLEHVTFFTKDGVDADPAVIERIVARGTIVSLTVGSVPGLSNPPPAIVQRMPQMLANAARLCRSGARVVLGTDAGIAPSKPHDVLPYALEALVDLGTPNADALRAATAVAAQACRVAPRKGRIAAGADADLLAVRGDPLRDIRAVHDVAAVYRAGRLVTQEAM